MYGGSESEDMDMDGFGCVCIVQEVRSIKGLLN